MRVGVVGCRFNTLRFLRGLLEDEIPVDKLITLAPERAGTTVSGYCDLIDFAKDRGIDTYVSRRYKWGEREERELGKEQFDIVFCVGWQRLLPAWFLNLSRLGVFGMHGSCYPLPGGRGRSPQVWSILKGAQRYYAHIFRYDPEADHGKNLHQEDFDITSQDTAATLQWKSQIVFSRTLARLWPEIKAGQLKLQDQDSTAQPGYFPQRRPEDGLINWNNPAQ